jgi:hypothetical protein
VDEKDNLDVCECECHGNSGFVHFTPCCAECPYCDDPISLSRYDSHLRRHCLMMTAALMIGVEIS